MQMIAAHSLKWASLVWASGVAFSRSENWFKMQSSRIFWVKIPKQSQIYDEIFLKIGQTDWKFW